MAKKAWLGVVMASMGSASTLLLWRRSNTACERETEWKASEKEEKLLEWTAGATMDRLNRRRPEDLEKDRHVIVLTGITGSGKSCTANTMMTYRPPRRPFVRPVPSDISNAVQATRKELEQEDESFRREAMQEIIKNRKFDEAGSLTSVTRSASFRDYNFRGVKFRIIDTPGLGDTNRDPSEIESEIRAISSFAPFGISSFVVVLPKGRITSDHEAALQRVNEVFGEDISGFSTLAITHALTPKPHSTLMTRDMLLDEIDKLPPGHFLRALVKKTGYRVVGVENKLEPFKSRSQVLLNQSVLDVVAANNGKRFQIRPLQLRRENKDTTSSSSSTHSPTTARCEYQFTSDPAAGLHGINIMCEKGNTDIPGALKTFLESLGVLRE